MRHTSDAINSDLDKLDDVIAANVKRVSSSDTKSTTILGANRPAGQVDMSKKFSSGGLGSQPTLKAPAMGSGKPADTWPRNAASLGSGLAKKGSLG